MMKRAVSLWIVLFILINNKAGSEESKRVVCYYSADGLHRNYPYSLDPRDLDHDLCTHLVYSTSLSDLYDSTVPADFVRSLASHVDLDDFVRLRKRNEKLKVMLSVGVSGDSKRLGGVAADPEEAGWFARQAVRVAREARLDGLDINWQWPGLADLDSKQERHHFTKLIQTLRKTMAKDAEETKMKLLILSVVVPPLKDMARRGFELDQISREVDFFNVLTTDYYSSTDAYVNHLSPLHDVTSRHCNREYTVERTVEYYLREGVEPEQLNLVLPLYGLSFSLESELDTDMGASAEDEGLPGFATSAPGLLAYFEICSYVANNGWTVKHPNASAMGPYAYLHKRWVSYDDAPIIRRKVEFANQKCLGGVALWTVDMDDFLGRCDKTFPLSRAAKQSLLDSPTPSHCTKSVPAVDDTRGGKPFKFIKREKWQAASTDYEAPKLRVFPPPYVVIGHTVSNPCLNFEQCKSAVQNIQTHHMSIGYGDIGYNFLVGGDGRVYEGLGWNRHGAHTLPFNARSLGLAFVGDFTASRPTDRQIQGALDLMEEAVRLGQLTPDYKVFGQRQVASVASPGNQLMDVIRTWPHWAEYDPIEDD